MKTLFILLASLFMMLAVIGGFAAGICTFAYGIYLIVLLIKGTIAVTFWAVLKAVICIVFCWASGWLTFFIGAGIAGLCSAIASKFKR